MTMNSKLDAVIKAEIGVNDGRELPDILRVTWTTEPHQLNQPPMRQQGKQLPLQFGCNSAGNSPANSPARAPSQTARSLWFAGFLNAESGLSTRLKKFFPCLQRNQRAASGS